MTDKPSVPPVSPLPPGGGLHAPNNTGIVTQGQTGNNTIINHGTEKLKFTDILGQELLAKVPMGKPVNVRAIGSPSDQNVGIQIANFLRANGYQVEISVIGGVSPPPDHALTWDASRSQLNVAPSVR